jgi:hypothetical protein
MALGTPTPVPSSDSAGLSSASAGGGGDGGVGAGAHAAPPPQPPQPPPATLHPAVAVSPLYANTLLLESLLRVGLYDDDEARTGAAAGGGGGGSTGVSAAERAALAAALGDPTYFALARRSPEAAPPLVGAATTTARADRLSGAGSGGGSQLQPHAQLLGALLVAAELLRLCVGAADGAGLRGSAALLASGQLRPDDAARELVAALAAARLLPEAALASVAAAAPAAVAAGHGPVVLSLLLHLADAAVGRGAGGQPSYRRAAAAAVDDDAGAEADAVEDDSDEGAAGGAGDDDDEPDGYAAGGYAGDDDERRAGADDGGAAAAEALGGFFLPPLPLPGTDPHRWHAECERLRPRLEALDRDLMLAATTGTPAAGSVAATAAAGAGPPVSQSWRGLQPPDPADLGGGGKWRQHVAAAQAAAALMSSSGAGGAPAPLQLQPPSADQQQPPAPLSAADVRRGLQELSRSCAAAVDGVRAAEARVDALVGRARTAATTGAAATLRRYRDASARLAAARQEAALRQAAVGDLTAQYHAVGERLEEVADAIAARTAAGGGSAQLAALRAALAGLRAESGALDVRLGLLGHSVMQARIAAGERARRAAAAAQQQLQQHAARYEGAGGAGGYVATPRQQHPADGAARFDRDALDASVGSNSSLGSAFGAGAGGRRQLRDSAGSESSGSGRRHE